MSNWRQWEIWTNVPFPDILRGIPFPDVLKEMMADAYVAWGLRQALLLSLAARFGVVPTELLNSINEISDADRLRELIHISVNCPDLKAFLADINPTTEIVCREKDLPKTRANPSPPKLASQSSATFAPLRSQP